MRVRLLPLPTTVTSLTMYQNGYLSSTVARVFLGRATTLHGLSRRQSAWRWKRRWQASAARLLSASLSGFAWLQRLVPNGPRLGNKVLEAKNVCKKFGDKVLFENLNFMLPPNGIVGIIGPNGAGKTTLFRIIMGLETADSGTFERGETVKMAYVDQQHKDIVADKSVYDVVSGGNETIRMGGKDVNVRAYLSRFNFSGADQEKKCGVLSGGERNRLHLAMALKEEGNVLLLDEPTNDIDVNTLRALEQGLEAFAGCAVVISHDRLRKVLRSLPDVRWLSLTTVGSLTVSVPISLPSRVTERCSSSREHTRNTKSTRLRVSEQTKSSVRDTAS